MIKKTETPKKVLVFSPHPDDDVISMGGTIHRLKSQGHQVMIAYMTSGANAVHDYELKKYSYFMRDILKYKKNEWTEEKTAHFVSGVE